MRANYESLWTDIPVALPRRRRLRNRKHGPFGPTDFKTIKSIEENWPLPLFCRIFSGLCRKPLIDPFLHSATMKSVSMPRGSTVEIASIIGPTITPSINLRPFVEELRHTENGT